MRCLIAILLVPLVTSCTPPDPPLRVGILEWPPAEILRLAYPADRDGGRDVQIVTFQSPAEARRAYLVGGLDIVALTFDHLVQLNHGGVEHRAFVVIDESSGSDAALSRTPVNSLSDLRGMRVGLEGIEIDAYFANRLLEIAGLGPQDIVPVFVDFPDQIEVWEKGDVDVMLTWEPVRTQLLERGAFEIFSSKELPGEILDVFIARESLLADRPDAMRRFTRSWFTALRRFRAAPADAAAILAPSLGMRPEQFLQAIEGTRLYSLQDNHRVLGGEDSEFLAVTLRVVQSDALQYYGVTSAQLPMLFSPAALPPIEADVEQ